MLAHREARSLAFGTEGKLRVLEEILANHPQERTLIFTDDNAMVYKISREFFIPAITHQTPVKERHDLLQQFRAGTYRILVTSRVLNEGVDVPEASIAVVLSGTATEREHIQRLGRILRQVRRQESRAVRGGHRRHQRGAGQSAAPGRVEQPHADPRAHRDLGERQCSRLNC